jgi:SH3 domain-containing YSC84-like protein 1
MPPRNSRGRGNILDHMMKRFLSSWIIAAALRADAPTDEHTRRIHEAATTLREILDAGDRSIPEDLIKRSQCVGIVPGLKRIGLIVGAKYGKGELVCRTAKGWSAPATIRVEGGSIGLQIGAGETDVVFLVLNRSGEDKLMRDHFTIGGDATVAAGPVGRDTSAQTDPMMGAQILAWSRARGVFLGVSLEGATLRPDRDDNTKIYGRPVSMSEIVHGELKPPAAAAELYSVLDRFPFKQR